MFTLVCYPLNTGSRTTGTAVVGATDRYCGQDHGDEQQLHRNRAAEKTAIKQKTAVKRVERAREEERVPVGEGKHITLQDSLDSEG